MNKREKVRMGIFAVIIIIIITVILLIINIKKSYNPQQLAQKEETQVDVSEKIKAKGWDTQIVKNLVDKKVPVPDGYEYVSGNEETGIIIKNKNKEEELMWIPYTEEILTEEEIKKAEESVAIYYKNEPYYEMETDTLNSINNMEDFMYV